MSLTLLRDFYNCLSNIYSSRRDKILREHLFTDRNFLRLNLLKRKINRPNKQIKAKHDRGIN